MKKSITDKKRCGWCGTDPLYIAYHDQEWGRPIHDDRLLFEFLILEGFQAGLSWITILRKRENFRKAFANFDAKKIVKFDAAKVGELMQNEGIIRNRLKIQAAITNAQLFLDIQKEYGSFDAYIWGFVGGKLIINARKSLVDLPAKTALSEQMSKEMGKRGFKFRGPTICYAFMQAVGMVDDHIDDCWVKKKK